MPILIILIVVLLLLALIVGLAFYYHSRKLLREQKNFERGLKMVPMLIHLPPQSTDTEIGARDERDVTDETISRAQTIYNIIASTTQKGFKSNFYGQRHFSFEIIGYNGFVHMYAAVPVALVEVVQQAITSAYPTARLEEVAEHNIFSKVGKSTGTMGGEFTLKEDSSFPIATYQELKRDTFQSLLNALSTLEKEEGAGVQILMRPANSEWRKKALSKADKKRKGKESTKKVRDSAFWWLKEAPKALVKPPEHGSSDDDKQISGTEQSIVDAMEEKARHATYEVLIRVIASSNVSQRAQSVMKNIVATFSLYDAPGRNGFKFTPAKDIDSFITSYILRFFPPENTQTVLNSIELATLFHFPSQNNIPTTQLERQSSKQVDGPRNIPDDGLLLGYNEFRGAKKKINLDLNDRRRHVYAVGQTGTGKSVFLENLALQDMLSGGGFAFIDPHGDTAEKLLSMVPKERTEDVYYFCPADMDYPMGLNLYEAENEDEEDFLIQEAINMLYKLYDPQHQGIIGPRYEHWFRMASKTLMASPEGATFIDIPKIFTDNQFAKERQKHVKNQIVLDFWNKEMAQTSDYHKSEILGWFVSKFGAFMANDMMRNIIGQTKSSFNLRKIMDEKKILIVNLSKGRTGELNSKLLGMIFVMKFQAAAMSRASVPEEEREDFALYVDEFQNFSTDSFASILSEARKYRLNLIVANQFTTQLTDDIRDAVFGNVGTIVSFRVGTADADFLVKIFQPVFDMDDLQRIPNYNAVVRTLVGGVPTQAFSMATLPPLGNPNKELGDALKQLSSAKFGRPRAIVEKEIFARISSPDLPPEQQQKPNFGRNFNASANQAAKPPRPSTGSSFLDDWLQKKETNSFRAPASPFNKPNTVQQQPTSSTQNTMATNPIPPQQTQSQPPATFPQASTASSSQPIQPQPLTTQQTAQYTTQSTESASQTASVGSTEYSSETNQPISDKPQLKENQHISTDEPQDHTVNLR